MRTGSSAPAGQGEKREQNDMCKGTRHERAWDLGVGWSAGSPLEHSLRKQDQPRRLLGDPCQQGWPRSIG